MLRLTEVDIDDEERPRNPHRIKSCEVGAWLCGAIKEASLNH